MKSNKLKNLTLIEFLELISGYNEIIEYTIKIRATDTKNDIEPLEITGRINDFKELRISNSQIENIINDIENKIYHTYSDVEIYNYLKKLTDNFSTDEVKLVLNEIEQFELLELKEEMNIYSELLYEKNKWEIPLKDWCDPLTKETTKTVDYEKMRNKVLPYMLVNINKAKDILNKKLQDNNYKKLQEFVNEHKEPSNLSNNTQTNQLQDEFSIVDLSNTKGVDKIRYLKELGILDFLRQEQPFNTSINSLATVLSAITGEKLNTLQSYINPIYSKDTSQKNNPLNAKNKVDNVRNKLIEIGFKPK